MEQRCVHSLSESHGQALTKHSQETTPLRESLG